MIRSELAPAYKFRANVRPVRHAYLVSARSSSQLERVMSFCCTQWGGIGNLIVPVTSNLNLSPIDEYLLKLIEPDVFVSYMPSGDEAGRSRHERLENRVSALWPERDVSIDTAAFESRDASTHALSAIAEDDLRESQFLDRRMQGPPSDRLALLAMFGRVYTGQEADYARLLQYGLSPVGLQSQDLWQQQMATDPFSSPIKLTSYGVRPYKVERPSLSFDAYYRVVVGDSVRDLCAYWNLRAVECSTRFPGSRSGNVLLLPYGLVSVDGLRALATALRSAPPLEASSNLDLGVYLPSPSSRQAWIEAIDRVSEFVRLSERVAWSLEIGSSSREPLDSTRKLTYQYLSPELPLRFWEGVHYELPPMTPLAEGDNVVRIEPPPGFSNRPSGHHMLDLDSDVWERYPKHGEVVRAIHENARFTRYGVTFVSSLTPKPSEFRFRLPAELETLGAVLRGGGLGCRESDKTRYLEAVVRLLGGFENVNVLASEAALRVLHALAAPPTTRLARRIISELDLSVVDEEELAEALGASDIVVELSAGSKSLAQLRDGPLTAHKRDLLPLLARLSEAGVIRRGFSLPCSHCGLTTWHPIGSVDESLRCVGCGGDFRLPLELPPGSELQMHYVLNSLVNRALDQGVVPALIAMSRVAGLYPASYCKTAALELIRDGDPVGDLDFTMFADGRLIAGEAKTGSRLQEKDLRCAELIADAGFADFYFCTVAPSFEPEALAEVELLRQRLALSDHDMQVIVFTGGDLLDRSSSQVHAGSTGSTD